jgi:hypothetical protein
VASEVNTRGDPQLDLDELACVIDDSLDLACAAERFPRPKVVVEPGRAVSARAGVTCYRVVAVKQRPGGRTFVAVDGGMSDSPRVALYGACYTVTVANRHLSDRRNRSRSSGGTARPATSSPTTYGCRPTCILGIFWRWPAPGRITTAWHRRSTPWDDRPWWPSTTGGPANWSGARRPRTCSPGIWDERLREDPMARVGATPAAGGRPRGG